MTIFIGTVLSKITSGNPQDAPVYEELTLEVKAYDVDAARDAMANMARERPQIAANRAGAMLNREVVNVVDVRPVLAEIYTQGVRTLRQRHFTDLDAFKSLSEEGAA